MISSSIRSMSLANSSLERSCSSICSHSCGPRAPSRYFRTAVSSEKLEFMGPPIINDINLPNSLLTFDAFIQATAQAVANLPGLDSQGIHADAQLLGQRLALLDLFFLLVLVIMAYQVRLCHWQ